MPKKKKSTEISFEPYTVLDFIEVQKLAYKLASIIRRKNKKLENILLNYETYEVVRDEVERSLDLLENLKENEEYFKLRIGQIASFLPRNQPLYAFCCFVVVPSLMASKVFFRIPRSMHHFFTEMINTLEIPTIFPNIKIFNGQRAEFIKEMSVCHEDEKTEEKSPITNAVIFTGTSSNADQLRNVFDKKTLFIANGSGHNPIVISTDADIKKAVDSVTTLQFYNQGQDCAAPNAILVHKKIIKPFLKLLEKTVREVKIGNYFQKDVRIGPISEARDLERIQKVLLENKEFINKNTPGVMRVKERIIEPTIIIKPLKQGGNYSEVFAPIIFVQEYEKDSDLSMYFENPHYAHNAMYITLFGKSNYIQNTIDHPILDKILHKKDTFIQNTHLHAKSVERGVKPYGGYGTGSSSISINRETTPMPTLPQRDIYDFVVRPLLDKNNLDQYKQELKRYTKIVYKNVEKLLKIKTTQEDRQESNINTDYFYIDRNKIKDAKNQFVKIEPEDRHHLSKEKNIDHIKDLNSKDITKIRKLKTLIQNKDKITNEEFGVQLYKIAKMYKSKERDFFESIYLLLFNKRYGPKLSPFLYSVDNEDIEKLLDI